MSQSLRQEENTHSAEAAIQLSNNVNTYLFTERYQDVYYDIIK